METSLLENKLAKNSPDFLYEPDIVNISIMEFNRYEEILKLAEPEIERFRDDMLKYKAGKC
jgi:predicted acylesterase/phospholipase RssA